MTQCSDDDPPTPPETPPQTPFINYEEIELRDITRALRESRLQEEEEDRKARAEGREPPPRPTPRPLRSPNPVDFGTVNYDEFMHLLESGAYPPKPAAQEPQTPADPAPTDGITPPADEGGKSPR